MEIPEHDNYRVSERLSQFDDNELVRLAKLQLPYVTAAYEVLFHRYHRQLVNVCYRYLGSLEEAEETVNDTMLNMFNNIARFEQRASFKTWIYKIAHNLSITRLRKKKLEYINIDETKDILTEDEAADDNESQQKMNTWLDSLSIEDRTIVVFRVVGCLEFSEIAEIVEQKLSAVKMRFKRALEKHAS